jgi:hypothetical protein
MDLPAAPPPRPDLPQPEVVIHEPSAAERMGRQIQHQTPEELGMSAREIRTGFLLAAAVFKLGGSMVLTNEECREHYALMEDLEFGEATDGIRLWSVKH